MALFGAAGAVSAFLPVRLARAADLTAGFVYIGPRDDWGWNQSQAVAAAALLYLIASGKPGFDLAGGLAANGYAEHSPGRYSLGAGFVTELTMTFMFLMIILGTTDRRAPQGFAPIAIGLALTLIHLISIPVTNTSVNPARSTGVALFADAWALQQLWAFWIAPLVGAVLGLTLAIAGRG